MFKKRRYSILIINLMLVLSLILTGCSLLKSVNGGGTTDHSDSNAPKDIESKEIVYFETDFYLTDPNYYEEKSGRYTFKVESKENKKYELSVEGPYEIDSKISTIVSNDVLIGIQEIIDQYKLVEKNGIDRVTAGLAPEYAPLYLLAEYASNEKLYFREDGNPRLEWTLAIRDYLEKVLIDAGFDELRLPEVEELVE